MKKAVFCNLANTTIIDVTDVDDPKVALNVDPESVSLIIIDEENIQYIQFYHDEKLGRVAPRVVFPKEKVTVSSIPVTTISSNT